MAVVWLDTCAIDAAVAADRLARHPFVTLLAVASERGGVVALRIDTHRVGLATITDIGVETLVHFRATVVGPYVRN